MTPPSKRDLACWSRMRWMNWLTWNLRTQLQVYTICSYGKQCKNLKVPPCMKYSTQSFTTGHACTVLVQSGSASAVLLEAVTDSKSFKEVSWFMSSATLWKHTFVKSVFVRKFPFLYKMDFVAITPLFRAKWNGIALLCPNFTSDFWLTKHPAAPGPSELFTGRTPKLPSCRPYLATVLESRNRHQAQTKMWICYPSADIKRSCPSVTWIS